MRSLVVVLLLVAASSASAQVVSRPTDAPIVTAENDAWYRQREPVFFGGEFYAPAGAIVFFNGNTMVRTGHFNGVPLYADTTIEPHSIVYVPIDRGMLQPYARVPRRDLAATSGSSAPSVPARTAAPQPRTAASAFTPEAGAVGTTGVARRAEPMTSVGTGGTIAVRPRGPAIETVRRPRSNDGVWIELLGAKWVSAGPGVPLRASEFVRVGDYKGFPVFARQGLNEEIVYLPTAAGLLVPYKLKP